MFKLSILAATLLASTSALPAPQQYPGPQEAKSPQLSSHYGYMYGPQQHNVAQLSQFPSTTTPQPPLDVRKSAQVLMNDPDFQMLARSLNSGTGSIGFSNPNVPREMAPCSSDGRSVTIDHLRISPESLVQIARLAQAFGTNPDWKKLRLADMKSALDTQMHPTHQYAARSIGL